MNSPNPSSPDGAQPRSTGGNGLWKGIAGVVVGLVALAMVAAYAFRENIFLWMVNPDTPFQTYMPPPAPDYSTDEAWAMAPETPPPGGWDTPWGVDVFFIHPTTHFSGDQWNAPIENSAAAERLDREALPNHAWPFQSAGPVYAPRYRQAGVFTQLNFGEDARQALALAYDDVARAFDTYLTDHNRGRGIMLVGVGQGGLHAQRLLEEKFTTQTMRDRLAAAYLLDAATPSDLFGNGLSWLKACETADDIHCVVSWGVVRSGEENEAVRLRERSKTWSKDGELLPTQGRAILCVNPLLWSTAGDFAPNRLHKGGAVATGLELGMTPAILPGEVATQCVDGVLVMDGPRNSSLKRPMGLGSRFKTPPFNLFYADLAENAAKRSEAASAWMDEFAAKPARPFENSTVVEDVTFVPVQDPEVNPSSQLRKLETAD